MKLTLDYPPIGLLGFLVISYLTRDLMSVFAVTSAIKWIGTGLIVLGLGLLIATVVVMLRRKATVIPHKNPIVLVTSGPFRFSRNPIYLGDAFTLLGFSLLCGSVIGLCLSPVFIWVIQVRFIAKEEARLIQKFGNEFEVWARQTRRWI